MTVRVMEDLKESTFDIEKFFTRLSKERSSMVLKNFEQCMEEEEEEIPTYRARLNAATIVKVLEHCESASLNGWDVKGQE